MNSHQAQALTSGVSWQDTAWFRMWMPYSFFRMEHDRHRHVFLPLNRNYDPIGYVGQGQADYADALHTHGVVFTRDPATFKGIWWDQGTEGTVRQGRFWLYDDTPDSRMTYFDRLEKLMLKAPVVLRSRQNGLCA